VFIEEWNEEAHSEDNVEEKKDAETEQNNEKIDDEAEKEEDFHDVDVEMEDNHLPGTQGILNNLHKRKQEAETGTDDTGEQMKHPTSEILNSVDDNPEVSLELESEDDLSKNITIGGDGSHVNQVVSHTFRFIVLSDFTNDCFVTFRSL
jgi:hypothetical protein